MKRQKTKARQSTKSRKTLDTTKPSDSNNADQGRRKFLANVRSWGVLGLLAAGGGWYLVDEVTATMAEHDLSKVGNGVPTIVQIHDPQCSRCVALQREARRAMDNFGDGELQYLVANIRSGEGQKFAAAHGVGHITLLLFDGKGTKQDTVTGNYSEDYLSDLFRSHVDRHGNANASG